MSKLPPASRRTVNLVFSFVKARYNIKRFTKKIFREICEAEDIILIDVLRLDHLGYYGLYKDCKYIALHNNLPLEQYLEVAGHECGHHFLKHLELTNQAAFGFHTSTGYHKELSKFKRQIIEAEANLFSALLRGKR